MIKYSPFDNLDAKETAEIRTCLCSSEKIYKKGDIIMQLDEKAESLGIIDSGIAYLIRIDIYGNRSIIDYYEKGDIFGKKLSPESEIDAYYILAKEKCKIMFINFDKLLNKCEKNCNKHTILLNNMIMLSLQKSQMHIDVLSQRTIKQKLITYFEYLQNKNLSDTFILPLSLSDLSEYLSVDRSAMMREIKKLRDENIIYSDGNKFIVKNNRYV